MSDTSKRKEQQKWTIEKPKLDNARRLRCIYIIDPDDDEFKDIMKNARRMLKSPMPAAMPCKLRRGKYRKTCRTVEKRKTKYGCIVEADESLRKCMEGSPHKNQEDHTAGKGMNKFIESLQFGAQNYSYGSSDENTRWLKERHKWSDQKTKLDNVRRLRGIYFIDLEDKEFKETIKNARKKLETPMAPAMTCKTRKKNKHGETRGKTNEIKSKLAYIPGS